MNPTRLQQARLAAGLSLQAVADHLSAQGLSISRAALSKHELGKSLPTPRVLTRLMALYGVTASQLLSPATVPIEWLAFRKRTALGKGKSVQIQALAQRQVEHQVELERQFSASPRHRGFPARRAVKSAHDAEHVAEHVRSSWDLGTGPLESVAASIEDHGGVVVHVSAGDVAFDGLSGIASGRHPVFVVNSDAPPDRVRYTMAHELGHLAMDCDQADDKQHEALANRFAGAFIAPAPAIYHELGRKRRRLDLDELKALKLKYGLSMQALMRRALDLDIISDGHYRALCVRISQLGWRKQEPIVCDAERGPSRLRQLLLRALAEGIVTPSAAEEILPGVTAPLEAQLGSRRRTAVDYLYGDPDERDEALARAAERTAHLYAPGGGLERFEAFGDKDLVDESDTE